MVSIYDNGIASVYLFPNHKGNRIFYTNNVQGAMRYQGLLTAKKAWQPV